MRNVADAHDAVLDALVDDREEFDRGVDELVRQNDHAAKRRRRSRRLRRLLNRPWYWIGMAVPTRIAQALPYSLRHFIWRRAVRGI